MVRCDLLSCLANVIKTLLMLRWQRWRLYGWEARGLALHVLSLSGLRLILPLLTISDSALNGAEYDAQSSLIALRLPDFFLIQEIR